MSGMAYPCEFKAESLKFVKVGTCGQFGKSFCVYRRTHLEAIFCFRHLDAWEFDGVVLSRKLFEFILGHASISIYFLGPHLQRVVCISASDPDKSVSNPFGE